MKTGSYVEKVASMALQPNKRLLAAIRGEEVDRVPLILEGFHFAAANAVADPGKYEILSRIHRHIHFFLQVPSFVNRYLVTPPQRMAESVHEEPGGTLVTTTRIDTPKGPLTAVTGRNPLTETIWTIKYPVESLADIEKIRSIPWELPTDLRPPDLRPPDLTSPLASFADRGIVYTGVSSPFVCVAGMMPYQYFLELCASDLGLIRDLTQICLDRILSVLDVLLSTRAIEYVWMGGCEWLTPPMASPALYEDLVQRFEKPIIDRIHAAGAISHIHCHGNVRSTLELAIERGGDFFEPMEPPPDGDITLAEAKALAAGRMTLGGNIEARILENEGVDTVETACRAAFEGGGHRMVFQTTAGPLSAMTPRMIQNYHRMIDVWDELSTRGLPTG